MSNQAAPAEPLPDRDAGWWLPLGLGVGGAIIGLALLAAMRRRRRASGGADRSPAPEPVPAPIPAPAPSPSPPARAATMPRPELDLAFRPRRAGMNLLSAAVDYELVVRNTGAAPARAVAVALQLFTAGNTHDTEISAFFAEPVDRPVVASFDLAPGDEKGIRALVMLPKEAVNVVTVRDRPMFVPIIAIKAVYTWGADEAGQTATSHVVGIRREGADKLQPFWLDTPARMYDRVGERAHAAALRR